MNLIDLTPEEAQNIVDGLALLPIHKGYNTFNKVLQQVQAAAKAAQAPMLTPVPDTIPQGSVQ